MAKQQHIHVNLQSFYGKLPPKALEAEAAVIGGIIVGGGEAWGLAAELVTPEDFHDQKHAAIYSAILDICGSGTELDMVKLNQRLADTHILDAVGGLDYLIELANSVPNHASVGYYAKIVRDKATVRRLIEATGKTLHDCYETSADAGELIGRAIDGILSLDGSSQSVEIVDQATAVQEVYDEIERRAESPSPPSLGMPTGITDLDKALVGIEPGTMTIIGGRTSDGKSALALQVADSFSRHGCTPLVFCLEMNRKQLAYRALATGAGISNYDLRRAQGLTADNWANLATTVGKLSQHTIDYAFTPGLTSPQLRTIATQRVRSKRCGAIFIDHLGLMRVGRAENRNLALGEITRDVKQLALDLDVPIVLLCQLNRESGKRDGAPQLFDLRESGHIEEDCDNAILIHRPEKAEWTKPGFSPFPGQLEPAELHLRKNRQGPLCTVEVWFDGAMTTFRNKAHDQQYGRVA